ncbi:uncharacterized protein [Phaseolus vulgaris]|uniref:uncharacterized protein n=1 Tax=Phaseolus vulgaris TaxID=3885 RepID=UPI0035CBFDCC
MRAEFPQAVSWIDQIPLKKWTQAYDGGKRYGHMTTNLVESINSVLKGSRSLPICALVKTIFERTNAWFVEQATKMQCMLRAEHEFPDDIVALLRKNEAQSAMCHVQRYDRENSVFDVQDMLTIEHQRYPITFTVTTFVAPVFSLHNILKAYEVQFNPIRNQDYWSTYMGPNFLPDPIMRRHQPGRPNTQRIRNEMDDSIPNKPKKCSYCRTEGHNKSNCPHKQA